MTETNDKNYIFANRDLEQVQNATSDPRKKADRKIIFTSKTKNIIKKLYFGSLTRTTNKIASVKEKIQEVEKFSKTEDLDEYDEIKIKRKLDKLADQLEILEIKEQRIQKKKERPIKVAGHARKIIIRNYNKILKFFGKNKNTPEEIENIKQPEENDINENNISEENIKNMVENEFNSIKKNENNDYNLSAQAPENVVIPAPVVEQKNSIYSLTKDQIIQDDLSIESKQDDSSEYSLPKTNSERIEDEIKVSKNPQTPIKNDSTMLDDADEIREQITPEVQAFFDKINGNIKENTITPALPDLNKNREQVELTPARNNNSAAKAADNLTISNDGKSRVYDFTEKEESKEDLNKYLTISDDGKSKVYDFTTENLTSEDTENVVDNMISDASIENNGKDNLEQLRELLLEQQHRQEQLEREKQEARIRDAQAKREAEELANQKAEKVEKVKAAVQAMQEGNASLESEIVKLKDEEQRHLSVKQQTITELHELDDMIQNVSSVSKGTVSKGK